MTKGNYMLIDTTIGRGLPLREHNGFLFLLDLMRELIATGRQPKYSMAIRFVGNQGGE